MAKTYNKGKELNKEIHVLRVSRQSISIQENNIKPLIIQNYQSRSQSINFRSRPLPLVLRDLQSDSRQEVDDIKQGLSRLCAAGYIIEVLNVKEYISPYSERVADVDPSSNLVDDIVAQYTTIQADEPNDDMPIEIPPPITLEEALKALYTLCRYKEENQANTGEFLRALRRQERELKRRQVEGKIQSQLDSWVVNNKALAEGDKEG